MINNKIREIIMTKIRIFKFFLQIIIFLGPLSYQAFASKKFSDFVTGISNEAEKKGIPARAVFNAMKN